MSDYISRQDAIKEIQQEIVYHNHKDKAWLLTDLVARIKDLPSVEPKKGMWINAPSPSLWGDMANHCSECGSIAIRRSDDSEILTDFCPWCGADMRGEEE